MKPEKTFHVDGLTVSIMPDDPGETPDEWDEACKLVTTDNRYFVVQPTLDDFGKVTAERFHDEDFAAEIAEHWHVFPLFAYIHSGVALSLGRDGLFSDRWDSGQIGFVLVSKDPKQIIQDGDNPHEQARLKVETWNQYLSGDIWGYEIERDGEHVDSCWGFYGLDCCEQEAREAAKHAAADEKEQAAKCAAMMAL